MPVALARLSERAGLDLVTFQDHPYQPAFLDAWTLLSYVAASTERIKISGNVINLPLRPPVLLARQAASLDLLSGGRFELGLGAGAFWEAIEAMGGPRRSPAEAVASLSEAIDLIRATWDAGRRGGIFADGEQYRIRGAKRGPEPPMTCPSGSARQAADARLIGRPPTAGCPPVYLKPGDLDRGNAIIDAAAAAAGAIRGRSAGAELTSEAAWSRRAPPMVVRDGVAVIVKGATTRERAELRRGGDPAVREEVDLERGGRAQPRTGAQPKAWRPCARIDYDALPPALGAPRSTRRLRVSRGALHLYARRFPGW